MGRDGRTTLHVRGEEGMGGPCYTHVRGGEGMGGVAGAVHVIPPWCLFLQVLPDAPDLA